VTFEKKAIDKIRTGVLRAVKMIKEEKIERAQSNENIAYERGETHSFLSRKILKNIFSQS
jgi:hypothetical protein